MKIKGYLIVLIGSEDLDIKIVSEDSWNAFETFVFTESMYEDLAAYHKGDPASLESDYYSINSLGGHTTDNDLALLLPPIKINESFASFWTMKDAIDYIKKHSDVLDIVDEYQGSIY
ncbi:hypothetical protein phiOC_p176 [Ochrobactrum phage vB_OspM_OC]|nr:hypothetical protein phiOC_p176 [Ochrobactrum phage vB_OspM_OC]